MSIEVKPTRKVWEVNFNGDRIVKYGDRKGKPVRQRREFPSVNAAVAFFKAMDRDGREPTRPKQVQVYGLYL